MPHVALLGDSSLDNAAYVPAGQAVIDHWRQLAPQGWQASLLAVDGSRTEGVARQLANLPQAVTHLLISVGGNDALGQQGVLSERAGTIGEALVKLADVGDEFQRRYQAMLAETLRRGLPTVLCTIYYPRYPDPVMQRVAVAGSTFFNDVIQRAATANGLPLLDLRLIFNDPGDYANAIEPSSQGGRKLAQVALAAVQKHDFTRRRSEVFVTAS